MERAYKDTIHFVKFWAYVKVALALPLTIVLEILSIRD
jgi:hypothetical protein